MADTSEMFFDGGSKYTPDQMYADQELHTDQFIREDTNILQLDDVDDEPVDLGDDESYPNFEDQGTLSDDGEGVQDQTMPAGGILDEDTIENGLSNLGRSADGTCQVFLHLTLPGLSLVDINILSEYEHLQQLDISYNQLTDLSALSNMPHLLSLDASHNEISQLLDFKPPKNLKYVNLSYNNIEEMRDLTPHHFLQTLILDNNHICEIKGLQNCKRLKTLSIAHNKVGQIQGLDNLPICDLNLSCNEIKKIENLESLKYLKDFNLSGNKFRSLDGLQGHEFLETVDLEDNEIIDLTEIQYLAGLKLLRDLNLQRNPIRELPDYRLAIIFHLPKLHELDRHKVTVDDKVAAANMFNPPMEVIASRDHIMHVVYKFLQPSRIYDSTLLSRETPYPMLILVGPQGAGKKDLALKLVEEFPDYFGYGVMHTTRKPIPGEQDGKDYVFCSIDEFEHDIKMGKFLQTYAYHGELYGLQMEAVEVVAREGLACVIPMELEGVMTLKNSYFEPRYVLVMPLSRECHERRLREKELYGEMEIQWTLDRAEMYADQNREHAGYFDMMINSDDITEAYKKLRRLVMDYLGIGAGTPMTSDFTRENTETELHREDTALTVNSANLARTWSKHSLADSLQTALNNVKQKMQSPMPTAGRGIIEERSLERRKSAAKDAVSGHVPNMYEQILKDGPKSVPQPVSAQMGLEEGRLMPSARAYSAPATKDNLDDLPPTSPDSSDSEDNEDTLTNISEAPEIENQDVSPNGSRAGSRPASKDDLKLPDAALDRMELMSGSNKNMKISSSGLPTMAPRPPSAQRSRPGSGQGSRPGSAASGRPGSTRHPVLPPIGQNTSAYPDF